MLAIICLFLTGGFLLHAQTPGNGYNLSLANQPFKAAVEAIEKATGYSISYSIDDVDEKKPVTIQATNARLAAVLEQLIKEQPLTYTVNRKHIILKKDHRKADGKTGRQGRKAKIHGYIYDSEHEPLIGAVVSVPGTSLTTTTDLDGHYTLDVNDADNDKVRVSYVGFKQKDLSVSGADNGQLDAVMQPADDLNLDEVVVIGYGQIKKESLSSAISTVGGDDLSKSLSVNTSGALAGKVAGINSRQTDGRPGAWTSINVRNMGTPLYVVDGVQMDERQFNNIAYQDIESISILKDASAAIYGVRAANGVVVVQTKRGSRNQKNTISLDASYGWQQVFRYPDPADGATYMRARMQSSTIMGQAPGYTLEELAKYESGELSGFNWKDYIFNSSAPQYNVALSATGGGENMSYYVSVGHTRQESLVKDYGFYERTNIQSNITADFARNLHFSAQINGRVENTESTAWNRAQGWSDAYSVAFYSVLNNTSLQFPYANNNPDYPALCGGAGYTNMAVQNRTIAGKENDRWFALQANASLEWEIISGLKLKGIFSYSNAFESYKGRSKSYKLYAYDEANDTYNVVKDAKVSASWARSQYIQTLNSQVSLSYNKEWKSGHKLDVFAGMEAYKYSNPGFSYNGLPEIDALKTTTFDELKSFSEWNENPQTRIGYMGRINYDFRHRYLLELAARYDGSWKFPPHHRWGFFPSVSGAWRVTQEPFFQAFEIDQWLSDLKIRASYGVMGDDNVYGYAANDYKPGFNYGTGMGVIDGSSITTSAVRSLPITNISWIKAKTFDIGFDIALFNSRLNFTADYFDRKRTGLPAARYDIVVPNEIGFSWPLENLNSDKIKGFDASLKWHDRVADFSYSVGGNITLARAYNWEQYKPQFENSRHYYVYNGHHRPSNQTWGLTCIGQFQNWEQIATYPVDIDGKGNSTMRPGDLIYKDMNGDGVITNEDQSPVGVLGYEDSRTPIINFNINLSAAWRGFDIAADFTGAAHITYIQNYEARHPFWGDGNTFQSIMGDQWHLADPTDINSELIPGRYPTMIAGNTNHINYTFSTFWMQDIWYLKLRNLTVGYTLPSKITKKAAISNLRFYASFQNLFSIDNVRTHTDPEIAQVAGFCYPTTRVYSIGFNLTF